jgi:hypothetical protein
MFWLDVFADRGAEAGEYTGIVEAIGRDNKVLAQARVNVELLPIDLPPPAECSYKMGFFSGMLPAPRMQQLLIDHNCNTMVLYLDGTAPLIRVSDSDVVADFTTIDQQFRSAKRLGISPIVWVLSTRPEQFPQSLHLEKSLLRASLVAQRKLTHREDNRILRYLRSYFEDKRNQVAPPVRELVKQWLDLVGRHAADAPWPDLAFCPMDQPEYLHGPSQQWAKERFADTASLISEAADGRFDVFGLLRNQFGEAILEYCDLSCLTFLGANPSVAEKARQGGRPVWGFANCKNDTTMAHARFLAGALPMRLQADGMLFWALEWGRSTAWRYIAGDVIYNASLIGIREGGDDRRYMEALLRTADDPEAAQAVVARLLAGTADIPYRAMNVIARDYCRQNQGNAELLEQLRGGVADEIIRLTANAK